MSDLSPTRRSASEARGHDAGYHFANKDRVLDGIVDVVFGEIDPPAIGADWNTAMRRRAISVRDALARHRWAIGMMESRTNHSI